MHVCGCIQRRKFTVASIGCCGHILAVANRPKPLTKEQIERLREGMRRKGWTRNQDFGMRPNTVGNALSGQKGVSMKTLKEMCRRLEMELIYVQTGMGPKWVAKPRETPKSLGVDIWLTETSIETTEEERSRLREFPWGKPYVREPDHVYEAVLFAMRAPEKSHVNG